MWYKVKELSESGLNISQIHYETQLDRATVRRYLMLSEQEFHEWIKRRQNIPKKLQPYYDFVKDTLEKQPYLSSPQIEDRLLEQFKDLPVVHSKTTHNLVKNIRLSHSLPKQKEKKIRDYEKLAERPFGEEAQADFGQTYLQTETTYQKKIYFFAIVLSRSRQKYVYTQGYPFTTATAIYAHELAFEYFQGIPKKIIYDQDRVFISEENLGDVILTEGFRAFCESNPFNPVFCKKGDPESKGKVENVVKYTKQNFLRGRTYRNDQLLQSECLRWLSRRANGKVHGATQKVPFQEWLIEKEYLYPLQSAPAIPKSIMPSYSVRKDNCIRYKGNFYSLPAATYKGPNTKVLLEVKDRILCIHNTEQKILAQHLMPQDDEKGLYIRDEAHVHVRGKNFKSENSYEELIALFNDPKVEQYLTLLEQDKPRYFKDNLKVIHKSVINASEEIAMKAFLVCLENSIYNGNDFGKVLAALKKQAPSMKLLKMSDNPSYIQKDLTPETSNINLYESILENGTN